MITKPAFVTYLNTQYVRVNLTYRDGRPRESLITSDGEFIETGDVMPVAQVHVNGELKEIKHPDRNSVWCYYISRKDRKPIFIEWHAGQFKRLKIKQKEKYEAKGEVRQHETTF